MATSNSSGGSLVTGKHDKFPTFRRVGGRMSRRAGKIVGPVRTRKFWRGVLITLLVLAALHASLNVYASALLNRELGDIRVKGEPLTLAEAAPKPVPVSQNAAPLYQQAADAMHMSTDDEIKLSEVFKNDRPFTSEQLAILQKNQRALELTREAARLPECRFPINWNETPAYKILFPQYATIRALARLMTYSALQKARAGDRDGALDDLRVSFSMSRHLQYEPTLIGFLVARAIDAIANRALARVLQAAPISAVQGHTFLASLPSVDWSAFYRHAMLCERAFSLSGFDYARSNPENIGELVSLGSNDYYNSGEQGPPAFGLGFMGRRFLMVLWGPMLKLDEVNTLRLWKWSFSSITPLQIPAPADYGNQFDRRIQSTPWYAIFTRILFPVFSRARDQRDYTEVTHRQREAALALSAYYVAHDSYPPQLSAAAAAWGRPLPTDPYSGRPFIYRSDGKTFELYSVGVNRKDDGGYGVMGNRNYNPTFAASGVGIVDKDDILWLPPPG